VVHKYPDFFCWHWTVEAGDAQACGVPPEVAPAPGEQASLHGRLRWEEGEDVVQQMVREGAYEIGSSGRRRTLVVFPGRHSVEQVAGVVGAARQRKNKRRRGGKGG
jgi:hypothetical protein